MVCFNLNNQHMIWISWLSILNIDLLDQGDKLDISGDEHLEQSLFVQKFGSPCQDKPGYEKQIW